MSTQGSKRYREDVRLRAVELVCHEGWSPVDAAKAVGCSKRSVQLWVKKSNGGQQPEALKTPKAPGAKPKLDAEQKQHLLQLLASGPVACGFDSQLWTCPRIAKLIQREFGVSYHVQYLPALLKALGWSVQKPKRRALERKEEAIQTWVANDWPRIKKKPAVSEQRSSSSTKRAF
jgi:transposase